MKRYSKNCLRVPILTYHSIDGSGSVISTLPEKFESQMRCLKDMSYRVISLDDLVSYLFQGRSLPSKSAVITFDDGLKSVYHGGYPILQKMGYRATVFLVSDYCGQSNCWNGQPKIIPNLDLLGWNEIKEMSDNGIDFGAHTLSHPHLGQISHDQAVREIIESKSAIQDRLNREIRFFAYPYGQKRPSLYDLIRNQFSAACSTELGFVTSRSDPFFLPRIDMYYFSRNNLFARLDTPAISYYLRFRHLLRSLRSRF